MKTLKTHLLLTLCVVFALNLHAQTKYFMQIEVSRSFTDFGDLFGNKLGGTLGIKLKKFNVDLTYSRAKYSSDDAAYFKTNTWIMDKEFNNFPLQNQFFKSDHAYNYNQNKGYYSTFSHVTTAEINILEIGMSQNYGKNKWYIQPRVAFGNAVIDQKYIVQESTDQLNYLYEQKASFQNLLLGYYKFYDVDIILSASLGFRLNENFSLLATLRSDYFIFSKYPIYGLGLSVRSSF
jgi:hypothetical protein